MPRKRVKQMGRPSLPSKRVHEVKKAYRDAGGGKSLRALGRELGLSPVTVARVLRDAGLIKQTVLVRASEAEDEPKVEDDGGTRPNLRGVAARAKVSISTASLALRGSPRVADSTRKRVCKIADGMGYQAHPYIGAQLAAVRRGKVRKVKETLAYLYSGFHSQVSQSWSDRLESPSGPKRFFDAAQIRAEKRGYGIEPIPYWEKGRSMARLGQILNSRGIRGLILDAPAYVVSDHPFNFGGYSTVSLRDQHVFSTHVFGHDNFLNTLRSICHLWRMGYRRIGYIGSDAMSISTLFSREAAVRHAQYHLMPEELRVPILHSDNNLEAIHTLMHTGKKMPLRNRPDAQTWVLSQPWERYIKADEGALPTKDQIMQGLTTRWLSEFRPEVVISENIHTKRYVEGSGFSVPDEIAVVHNNINFDVEGWTGTVRGNEAIAETAVEQLCNSVELGQMGSPIAPMNLRVVGEWVVGSTTKELRKPLTPYTTQADRFIRRTLGEIIE